MGMFRVPSNTVVAVFLFIGLVGTLVSSTPLRIGDSDILTAYQLLQNYGFPVGILPIGVTGYKLDEATGKFEAYFDGTCSFSLEGSYQLKYQSTIKGVISKGRISNLSGISVKVLFFWLNVVEVKASGDSLEFSVGIVWASFPLDNFLESPQCGCGFSCNNLGLAQIFQKFDQGGLGL